jgi:glycerate-2-kinase
MGTIWRSGVFLFIASWLAKSVFGVFKSKPAIKGESWEAGIVMAGIARSVRRNGLPVKAPAVLLSGGETTVTNGAGPAGRGGCNTEFLLGFALAIAGEPDIYALADDSDGIDGTEDAAGGGRDAGPVAACPGERS